MERNNIRMGLAGTELGFSMGIRNCLRRHILFIYPRQQAIQPICIKSILYKS